MAAIELAAAYLPIIPSLRGAKGQIESQLSGIDTTKSGELMGDKVSKGIVTGLNFDAISTKVANFGGKLESIGGTLTTQITKPVGLAATAVSGLVATLGFKRLVGIDTARGQFKGLGYDADAVMKQVDAGVTNTSLSMAQGASMAVGILATGAVPLEGLEAQIKRVSNVSAAYGVEAEQAAYLLNNVLTKNKVTWGDLSQMQQNQIPIVSQLADYYGVTGEAIMEMAQNGEISIEDLNTVLDQNAGKAAEEYANTWQGVTANIMSNIGRMGAQLLDEVFPKVKDQLSQFLTWLKSDDVKAWAAEIGTKIGNAFDRMIEVIKKAVEWWQKLSPGVQDFAIKAGIALVAAGPILTFFGKVLGPIGKFVGFLSKLGPVFNVAFGGVKLLVGGLKLLWAVMLANPIGVIITIISAIVAGLVWFFTQTEIGKEIWQGFVDFLTACWEVIKIVAEAVWNGIADFFSGLWEGISAAVIVAWIAISEFFSALWTTISTALTLAWQAIGDFFTGLWQGISDTATSIWTGIGDFLSGLWNGISSTASSVWSGITGAIGSAWDTVSRTTSTVWSGITSGLSSAWSGITSGVGNGVSNVMSAISGLKDKIFGFFSNAGSWLWDSGQKIIGGLIDGIKSMIGSIGDAIGGAMEYARSWLPFSPAKRGPFSGRGWTLYSGQSIMTALAEGVSQKSNLFSGAVEQAMNVGQSALHGLDGPGLGGSFSLSTAAPVAGGGVVYNDNRNVYNPVAEPDSIQTSRVMQLTAAGGGLG